MEAASILSTATPNSNQIESITETRTTTAVVLPKLCLRLEIHHSLTPKSLKLTKCRTAMRKLQTMRVNSQLLSKSDNPYFTKKRLNVCTKQIGKRTKMIL